MQFSPLLALSAALLASAAFALVAGDDAAAAAASDVEVPAMPEVVGMSMLLPAVRIGQRPVRLVGFSWNDCSGAGAWVKVKSVSVQPDPIDLNGKITVSFAYSASHSFGDGQPLAAQVVMKKRVLGTWLKLPCINNVGSCDYGNVCDFPKPPATCPAEFVKANVPCKCPFPAGNFSLPGYAFTVDASKIPKFLESGSYQVSVNVNSAGNQVLCANAELSLA